MAQERAKEVAKSQQEDVDESEQRPEKKKQKPGKE